MLRILCVSLIVGVAFAGAIGFDPIIGPVSSLKDAVEATLMGDPIGNREARLLSSAQARLDVYSVGTPLPSRLKLLGKVAEQFGRSVMAIEYEDEFRAVVTGCEQAVNGAGLDAWQACQDETDLKVQTRMIKLYDKANAAFLQARDAIGLPSFDIFASPAVLKLMVKAASGFDKLR